MMTHKIFNRASLRAGAAPLALGMALVAAAPAFAQAASTTAAPAADAAPAEQEIVVTGTLFRNAAAATASPVTVLARKTSPSAASTRFPTRFSRSRPTMPAR